MARRAGRRAKRVARCALTLATGAARWTAEPRSGGRNWGLCGSQANLGQGPIGEGGFTDSTGSNSFNQDLSDRRARAVRTALMDTGISADRITNRGYGDTFPVATNATAAGRQLNRRVEIVVSDDGKMIAPR